VQDKLYDFAKTVMPTFQQPGQGTCSLHGALPLLLVLLTSDLFLSMHHQQP